MKGQHFLKIEKKFPTKEMLKYLFLLLSIYLVDIDFEPLSRPKLKEKQEKQINERIILCTKAMTNH